MNVANERGKISFIAGVLMSINIIVGAGIFAMPQLMAQKAGNFSFLGWIIVALLFLPIIWGVANAARIFPGTGGFYNYCSMGLGEKSGFLALWLYLLGYVATAATLTSVLTKHLTTQLHTLLPSISPIFYTITIITVVCFLNLLSVTIISKVQSFTTILKLLPLLCVIAIFGFYWDPTMSFPTTDLLNIGATLPMAIFGFWGFETCCSLSEHLQGGPSKVFSIILTAFLSAAFLYTMFHFSLLHIMGAPNLAQYGVQAFPQFLHIKSTAMSSFLGLAFIVTLTINFFNSVYGLLLLNVDNTVCLARKKLIFFDSPLTKLNVYQRPIITTFVHGLIVFLLVTLIPNTSSLASLTNLGIVLSSLLVILAVLKTQIARKLYGASILTLLGILSCLIITYYSWMDIEKLIYTLPLFFGIALGLVMYSICKKRNTLCSNSSCFCGFIGNLFGKKTENKKCCLNNFFNYFKK
ncbi:MAG: APC family permease [bacterium]